MNGRSKGLQESRKKTGDCSGPRVMPPYVKWQRSLPALNPADFMPPFAGVSGLGQRSNVQTVYTRVWTSSVEVYGRLSASGDKGPHSPAFTEYFLPKPRLRSVILKCRQRETLCTSHKRWGWTPPETVPKRPGTPPIHASTCCTWGGGRLSWGRACGVSEGQATRSAGVGMAEGKHVEGKGRAG